MTVDGEYVGKTEIIEASEPESESCQLPEYPEPTGGATGGLVKNKVIVCGGANWKHQVDPFSECYAFKDNQVKSISKGISVVVFCCIASESSLTFLVVNKIFLLSEDEIS